MFFAWLLCLNLVVVELLFCNFAVYAFVLIVEVSDLADARLSRQEESFGFEKPKLINEFGTLGCELLFCHNYRASKSFCVTM